MTDKQRYIVRVIEGESEHRLEESGLSAYKFIEKYMDVYHTYKVRLSIAYGMARLGGLTGIITNYSGDNPMDYKN